MTRYRVSSVARFAEWERDVDADTGDLIDSILGRSEPSQAMRAGTAFHSILERASVGDEIDEATADGFTFMIAADFDIARGQIQEVRASKTYIVDGEPIVIRGQLDSITGKMIEDHKTTSRVDPDRYLSGWQWRLYLDIFGADVFRWNVFEMSELPSEAADSQITYEVRSLHRLEQTRYPDLGADCQAIVERFARFVRENIEAHT